MSIRAYIKQKISPERQMSEAFVNSALLALSGGFMDAYTYNCRDGVFANAETGNIVLMGQHFIEKDWSRGFQYMASIIAFGLGIFVAENIRRRYKFAKHIHWRQSVLLMEIAMLAMVGFLGQEYNLAANIIVAFSAALQVQSFRKVEGYAYASTMCTGNLRSGVDALTAYMKEGKREQLEKAGRYFLIIVIFAFGAGIGGVTTAHNGIHMIWFCCVVLALSVSLMALEGSVE